ncbi:MAG: NAD(P)/FAD-dependent oxidoreductase [Bdellovibrionota bacterium]
MDEWDVIVVGAGPAGASAGWFLARGGAKVLLLDRSGFPREKVCGDGLTPRSVRMLEALGLGERYKRFYHRIDGVRLVSPDGTVLSTPLPASVFGGVGCTVPRKVLDNDLLENAVAAGAHFRASWPVRSVEVEADRVCVTGESGERLVAKAVIGADGAYSVVRRSLRIPPNEGVHSAWAIRAYLEGVELDFPHAFEVVWDRDILPAYAWVFPLGEGRANVGIGTTSWHLEKMDRKLPDLLAAFLEKNPHLKGRARERPKGHCLPLGSFLPRTWADRALLAGDAASLINPLTGDGIEYAMESGRYAAEALLEGLAEGDLSGKGLRSYERRWRASFAHTLKFNWRMRWFFNFPSLVDRLFRVAGRYEDIPEELAGLVLGARSWPSPGFVARYCLG